MYQYSDTVTNSNGTAVEGASVRVLDQDGVAVTLYSDNGVTSTTNPVTTDSSGAFSFYVAAGTYDLEITKSGYGSKTLNNVVIPGDYSQASLSAFATGDGVTDEAAAVQNAIDSGAKYIYGEAGKTYLLGAAGLQFASLTGVKFIGNGAKLKFNAAATQTVAVGGSTMLLMTSCTDCEISGWEVDGNSKASAFVSLSGCTECKVTNNRVYSSGYNAQIFGINNTRCTYAFNTVYSSYSTARGIWVGGVQGASQLEIDPLIIGNVVRDNGASGIVVAATGGRVSDNHSEGNAGSGITIPGASGYLSSGITINGNVCRGNSFHGIQSDVSPSGLTYNTTDIVVTGNICEGNVYSGIYAVYAKRWNITGNTCRDNGDGQYGAGITFGPASDCIASGNLCYDTRTGGSRTQEGGIDVVAVVSANDCNNITITGNNCYNNNAAGINLNGSGSGSYHGIIVSGNTMRSNGDRGIYIQGSGSGVVFTGNHLYGNTTRDVYADIQDITISGNKFSTHNYLYPKTFADGDTTPTVAGRNYYQTNNTNPTTITHFDDGTPGQEIVITFLDTNTTISSGTYVKTSAAFTSTANDSISFIYDGATWYEKSRSVN